MTTHFPTVPVEGALRAAHLALPERLRPLALVVDDDVMITSTLAAIMNGSGVAAITARDGLTALETARVIPPEVLISDLRIPGISGLDLAVEVTSLSPDCDVILFAENALAFNLSERMRRSGRNFVVMVKPVHPADLLDAVYRLLSCRGQKVNVPRVFRSPGAYDFLSITRRSGEASPTNCNVTFHQRSRATIARIA